MRHAREDTGSAHIVGESQVAAQIGLYHPPGFRRLPIASALSNLPVIYQDSLPRLQTDHIDLYQMHHIDRRTPWEEIWQAMQLLVQQGKVFYVGSSSVAGWDIATAQGAAVTRHFMGLVSEQSLYNLTARTVELEVIPACRHYGLGFVAWGPLGGGLLGGVLEKSKEGRHAQKAAEINKLRPQLEKYEALCREVGERPVDGAMAWLLHNPVVTAPITGPRTTQQLKDGLRAVDISLSEETLRRLHEIWPGPGGEAPQAYAW